MLEWRRAVEVVNPTLNSDGNSEGAPLLLINETASATSKVRWTWDDLSDLGPAADDYVKIAKQMAYEYGYDDSGNKISGAALLSLKDPGYKYQCGFSLYSKNKHQHWECWLVSSTGKDLSNSFSTYSFEGHTKLKRRTRHLHNKWRGQ